MDRASINLFNISCVIYKVCLECTSNASLDINGIIIICSSIVYRDDLPIRCLDIAELSFKCICQKLLLFIRCVVDRVTKCVRNIQHAHSPYTHYQKHMHACTHGSWLPNEPAHVHYSILSGYESAPAKSLTSNPQEVVPYLIYENMSTQSHT